MNFGNSSHRKRWIYTAEQLQNKRQECLDKSVSSLYTNGEDNDTGKPSTSDRDIPKISVEDQQHLLKFFEGKISLLCNELKFPVKVKATAQMYLKRYYLSTSVITMDPSRMMLTCIYLAGKIEEHYISAEDFTKRLQQDVAVVLRNEVALLQGLNFDLVVHSPYRALQGLFQDIEESRKQAATGSTSAQEDLGPGLVSAGDDVIGSCRARAMSAVDALMLSDAPLLYPPGRIALAALTSGFKAKGVRVQEYLRKVARQALQASSSSEALDEATASISTALDELDRLGAEGAHKVDEAEVRELDRRLKLLRQMLQEAAAAQQAGAAGERDKAERREAKLRARRDAAAAQEAALLGTAPAATATTTTAAMAGAEQAA